MAARSKSSARQTSAIATPSTVKRAALLFDMVFLVQTQREMECDLTGLQLAKSTYKWLNSMTLNLKPELRYLYDDHTETFHKLLAKIAKAIAGFEKYRDYTLIPLVENESDIATGKPSEGTLAYSAAMLS
jgi:hypothetical protein